MYCIIKKFTNIVNFFTNNVCFFTFLNQKKHLKNVKYKYCNKNIFTLFFDFFCKNIYFICKFTFFICNNLQNINCKKIPCKITLNISYTFTISRLIILQILNVLYLKINNKKTLQNVKLQLFKIILQFFFIYLKNDFYLLLIYISKL